MLFASFLLSKSPQRACVASNKAGVGYARCAQARAVMLSRSASKAPVESELPLGLALLSTLVLDDHIALSVKVSASLMVKPVARSSARACVYHLAGVASVSQVLSCAGRSAG